MTEEESTTKIEANEALEKRINFLNYSFPVILGQSIELLPSIPGKTYVVTDTTEDIYPFIAYKIIECEEK